MPRTAIIESSRFIEICGDRSFAFPKDDSWCLLGIDWLAQHCFLLGSKGGAKSKEKDHEEPMRVKFHRRYRPGLEIFTILLLVWAVNLWFFKDPAYESWSGLPYFLVPALFAGFYGTFLSLWAAGASLLIVSLWFLPGGGTDVGRLVPGFLAGLTLTTLVLFLRSLFMDQTQRYRSRFRDLVRRNRRLEMENATLAVVAHTLETRIAKQRRSLRFLVNKLNALDRGNLPQALEEILEMVHIFIGAEKASFWRYEAAERSLVLTAFRGWEESDRGPTTQPADGTIPGWVCRNGQPFSLRMAVEQDHFSKLNPRHHLLTYPLRMGERIWGVLNVEAMPFVQYSLHAETMLEVILKLAEKSLKPIIERELRFRDQESNLRTGLPLATLLIRILGEELLRTGQRQGSLSLVVIEVANSEVLMDRAGAAAFQQTLARLATLLRNSAGPGTEVFHGREDHQLALYLTDRDTDGTALFALELLGKIQSQSWTCGTETVQLEILIGYDISRQGQDDPEKLLLNAERLIQLQRQ